MELAGGSSQSQIPLCMPLWVYASGCSLDYVTLPYNKAHTETGPHCVLALQLHRGRRLTKLFRPQISQQLLHLMASTPPPSPPPPTTPLTSPQRQQHAGRHQERLERVVGSPEQRRVPAPPPLTFSISAPVAGPSVPMAGPSVPVAGPSVPVAGPSVYRHLPAQLAAQLAALTPLPPPSRRSVSASNRRTSLAPAPQISVSPLHNCLCNILIEF